MEDLEHKISELLSSPGAMEQIMSMARALSGGGAKPDAAEHGPESAQAEDAFDPSTVAQLAGILGKLNEPDSGRKTALIAALKPYLSEDRRKKVDRALALMRMSKIARAALKESEGGKEIV
ncbi:MAG: hypothetical protein ACOX7P_03195 [Oscillospiraceae bacterium]|jgi:hypothetical protein